MTSLYVFFDSFEQVNLCNQSQYGYIRTKKTSYSDTFQAMPGSPRFIYLFIYLKLSLPSVDTAPS